MKKPARVLLWIVVTAGVLLGATFALAWFVTGSRLGESHDVAVLTVPVPDHGESRARGRHLAEAVTGCTGCHGEDLGGAVVDDTPFFARFIGSNLTTGKGSAVEGYTDEDWVRAIRHGLDREGRPLILMPSLAYSQLDDRDLGDLVAYLKSVPPVDRTMDEATLGPMGRFVHLVGGPFLDAREIDHAARPAPAPPAGPTAAYGRYLGASCRQCHGAALEGGMGPDLLPDGTLAAYDEESYRFAMRTGQTPDGRQMDTIQMPWQNFGRMTETELLAIWMYLQEKGD